MFILRWIIHSKVGIVRLFQVAGVLGSLQELGVVITFRHNFYSLLEKYDLVTRPYAFGSELSNEESKSHYKGDMGHIFNSSF
jgi:hypothetical protein